MFAKMISIELKQKVLSYLYNKYLNDSGLERHDIRIITDAHMEQARKAGLYLLNRGLIGNQQFSQNREKSSILTILNKIGEIPFGDPKNKLIELRKDMAKSNASSEGSFSCSITMLGIKEVAPEFIIEHTKTIITALGKSRGFQNLTDILKMKENEYQKFFDLGSYLQKLGYITIENSGKNIYAELTFFGKNRYEIKNN